MKESPGVGFGGDFRVRKGWKLVKMELGSQTDRRNYWLLFALHLLTHFGRKKKDGRGENCVAKTENHDTSSMNHGASSMNHGASRIN